MGGGGTVKLCQNICQQNMYCYQITLAPKVNPFKKLIFGGPSWGDPGRERGWHSQTMSKYLSVKCWLISKKTVTLA